MGLITGKRLKDKRLELIVGTRKSTNIIVSQNTQQALMQQEGRKRNKIVSIGKQYSVWFWLNLWDGLLTCHLKYNDQTGGREEETRERQEIRGAGCKERKGKFGARCIGGSGRHNE